MDKGKLLLALGFIIGALVVSYGFSRIEDQQHRQDKFDRVLAAQGYRNGQAIEQAHTALQVALELQANSDETLCLALNQKLPTSLRLNCQQIRLDTLHRVSSSVKPSTK